MPIKINDLNYGEQVSATRYSPTSHIRVEQEGHELKVHLNDVTMFEAVRVSDNWELDIDLTSGDIHSEGTICLNKANEPEYFTSMRDAVRRVFELCDINDPPTVEIKLNGIWQQFPLSCVV